MNKDKIKNGLIIFLIALIVLFGIFGGKRVVKYQQEISSLKQDKDNLASENVKKASLITALGDTVKIKDAEIAKLMAVFNLKDRQIKELTAEKDSALSWLNFITADSSYIFLQEVAYNYPGALKFLFNELQVKHIHSDYIVARNYEKIVPVMKIQISNCKDQFVERDNQANSLKGIVQLQQQTIDNCNKISQDNDKIIKDTEKQRDKEAHRKNFWRFTTAVSTTVLVIVSVFGL